MSALRKKIFLTAIFLAVVFAQVFGLQQGFACDHYRSVIGTGVDHCHKASVPSETEHVPCEGTCDDQTKAPHAPVVLELTARSGVSVAAPEFVAIQVSEMFAQSLAVTMFEPELTHTVRYALLTESQRPPTASVQVARSVVLRV